MIAPLLLADDHPPSAPHEIIQSLRTGGIVVLASRNGGNGAGEAVLFGVAAQITEAKVALMAVHARGLVSITVDLATAFRLGLQRMPGVARQIGRRPEYLVSIESATCAGTGISAADRAQTIRTAGMLETIAGHIVTPGHVMPLLVRTPVPSDGTLPEFAHAIITRSCDHPVAVWCQILSETGDVATYEESRRLADQLGLAWLQLESDIQPHSHQPGAGERILAQAGG